MFAQESVMGIKKEREAFERLPLAELAIESEFVFYNEETNSYWPNEDFCPSDAPETMNFAWEAWQAAKAHEAEKLKGCVLVPVQCPDPDFADSLFDELSKKAIGEFGDDLLIHFSDIDEEKIWALMVEAAKAQAVLECTWVKNEDGYFDDALPFTDPEINTVHDFKIGETVWIPNEFARYKFIVSSHQRFEVTQIVGTDQLYVCHIDNPDIPFTNNQKCFTAHFSHFAKVTGEESCVA